MKAHLIHLNHGEQGTNIIIKEEGQRPWPRPNFLSPSPALFMTLRSLTISITGPLQAPRFQTVVPPKPNNNLPTSMTNLSLLLYSTSLQTQNPRPPHSDPASASYVKKADPTLLGDSLTPFPAPPPCFGTQSLLGSSAMACLMKPFDSTSE